MDEQTLEMAVGGVIGLLLVPLMGLVIGVIAKLLMPARIRAGGSPRYSLGSPGRGSAASS